MNIDFRVQKIIAALTAAGYEAYLAGGCVRDAMLGLTPSDWDVCTAATPDEIKTALAEFHTIDTGIRHGTVTAVCGALPVEITTFRVDGEYLDRRRPSEVTFTRNLETDLARRDFTINAMAYSPERGLIDLFAGMSDLQERVIRAVGDPDMRLGEDALRILRALRFASQLDFSITADLSASIHRNAKLLRAISAERISAEFSKLLLGGGAERVLSEYADVIRVFLPELSNAGAVSRTPPDLTARLALLLCGAERGIIEARLRALRFDNAAIRGVLAASAPERLEPSDILRQLHAIGDPETLRRRIAVQTALYPEPGAAGLYAELDAILAEGRCWSLRQLAIGGSDLLMLGYEKSPAIGQTLEHLLQSVIRGELPNSREELLAAAKIS